MADTVNPNSATYWLPRLQEDPCLALRVPRSVIVPYDHHAVICAMEGEREYKEWGSVVQAVRDEGEQIGWPVFIRSCLASAKHNGPNSYRANSPDDVVRVLSHTAEDSELKFWLDIPPSAFVVREFLNLDAPFTAFHGLPIAREWRFFASPSEIICAHPYWPEESINFFRGAGEPEGWRAKLAALHERPQQWEELETTAIQAAAICDALPNWSVDFAMDTGGKWWLIDMADMSRSWHWPNCPSSTN